MAQFINDAIFWVELEKIKPNPFQPRRDGTYEPRDPGKFSRDLAASLNRVLRNPSLRGKFSEEGRRRAETNFSWAGVAKKTHALYRSLVK